MSAIVSGSGRALKEATTSHLPNGFWYMLALIWVLSALQAGVNLKHGWVAHDEGTFAQSAERVLHGELPHRDFDELYTGGLTFANALAFRILGVNLASLRIALFTVFLLWVPFVFYIASRFTNLFWSAALTLVAVAWSVPNYSAAVPSWYSLFFACFGTAALLHYIETRARRWLFVAGLCGGASILIKVTGFYFVAAAFLFFVFDEQTPAARRDQNVSTKRDRLYTITLLIGLGIFVSLLAAMILRGPSWGDCAYFLLPPVSVVLVLVSREVGHATAGRENRCATLFSLFPPFLAGAAVPVLIFLIPFLYSSGVPALLRGVFVLPAKRLDATAIVPVAPPPLNRMIALLPIAFLLWAAYSASKKLRIASSLALAMYLVLILHLSAVNPIAYGFSWFSVATAIPLITILAALFLAAPRFSRRLDSTRQQQLMLLVSVLAMTNLVQFPFSAPIYFCYVAPIVILTGGALLASTPHPPRMALGALLVFYLLFAVWRITPAFVYNIGFSARPYSRTAVLNLSRGGKLRIDEAQAHIYEKLIPFIQAHASGDYIYAGPDCPEIYFLSGLRNPTRTLEDSFDDPRERTARLLDTIETHHITVLTFNEEPGFAGPINRELEQAVQARFPQSKQIGSFVVRWRD